MGRVCVYFEPKALAAGPAGPLLVGRVCVYFEPKVLAAAPAYSQNKSSSVLPSAWQIFRQRLMVGL